jgi:cysteine desulfurase
MKMRVYMDYNSTTPVDPRVVSAMVECLRDNYGNPSSIHSLGAAAAAAMERARFQVAALANAEPEQVLFCSSATEAINTAVRGAGTGTLVMSCVEHAASLESAASQVKQGGRVTEIRVDTQGALDWDALERAIRQGPALVSVMWVNNETGVVFPIANIAQLCETNGVPLHVDAVQAAGKIDVDFSATPIDFLSISSHKIFGPKGAAALVARDAAQIRPLLVGGGQEKGLRGGTENVPGIVGFGEAASLAKEEKVSRVNHVRALRDRLEGRLSEIRHTAVNGSGSTRVANTSNIAFAGVDSNDLMAVLDGMGVAVSNGSACHSRSLTPSHVVMAMTGSRELASESIRFSLSHLNTVEEVDYTCECVAAAIGKLR